ncbi:thiol peroxidase [Oceanicola sp. 22II-s10i]|uniref:peroxiredoxin n=1 Tax=Oceanicola sp. 22II-s10i TaxID=1317116 RepID=UPI000B5215A3|nr:peroxiredoxin [Oceanicola sp. 22II-s10i]OWU86345.1 thiol peroxidase [Oceanicola sp. 22II-s10i]
MTISTGDTLPEATMIATSGDAPSGVKFPDYVSGRKVVIFGLPAAFSGTCTTAHVPSFLRNREALAAKGVDEVICVSVNDFFAMKAWDGQIGASAGGITMLADGMAEFTKAIGMDFTAPPVGFIDRSKRYTMLVEDGVVTALNLEESPGQCSISAAETLLDQM